MHNKISSQYFFYLPDAGGREIKGVSWTKLEHSLSRTRTKEASPPLLDKFDPLLPPCSYGDVTGTDFSANFKLSGE
jgi:hypothetical protein